MNTFNMTFNDLVPGMILYRQLDPPSDSVIFLIIAVEDHSFTYVQRVTSRPPVIMRAPAGSPGRAREIYHEFMHINLVIPPHDASIKR